VTDAAPIATTVVIPVWDRYAGQRLAEAVSSVVDQGRGSRTIVVDNASRVSLPELDGIEVIHTDRRLSLGAARNFGLAQVTTANVIFWDADDLMPEGTLGFLEDSIAGDPGLVAFGAAIIEEPSGLRHRWPRPWISRAIRRPRLFALLNSVWSMFPTTGATIMRTAAVRECGGYADAEGGEDWCMGAALLFRGPVGWSERPGRHYLQHEDSVRNTYGTARHQLAYAAAVRERLSHDRSIPAAVRIALPVLATAQYGAVGAHLAAAELRRLVRRRRRADEA
jgi:glycosyltransferase involved in cell wall biosynthesis